MHIKTCHLFGTCYSPLLLLSSTKIISFNKWAGVLSIAEWMERRITERASFTNMKTMLTSGRLSGKVRFLHLWEGKRGFCLNFWLKYLTLQICTHSWETPGDMKLNLKKSRNNSIKIFRVSGSPKAVHMFLYWIYTWAFEKYIDEQGSLRCHIHPNIQFFLLHEILFQSWLVPD